MPMPMPVSAPGAISPARRRGLLLAAAAGIALALSGCSSTPSAPAGATTTTGSVQIEDNHGSRTVPVPPQRVVATDNRTFQTLHDWGVKLVAAPQNLIAPDNPYRTDSSIVNLGTHGEPKLEAIVAAQPDLIVNGQRFAKFYNDFATLVPTAAIVELDPREGQPLDKELKRQVEVLGRIFGHEADAQRLIEEFDASIQRVKAAYSADTKAMAVITSGGKINYAAPGKGRTLGPVFAILGLTPAISPEGSTDHEGDEISAEAIAEANPGLILVMDRDAAVSANTGAAYTPASELLASSPALQNVAAVQQKRIVVMPQFTYLNEGIQSYTAFFNAIADALK